MFKRHSTRWITVALLATTSLLMFAPVAQADRGRGHGNGNGNGRRYKGEVRRVYTPSHSRPVYVRQSSGAGPVLAGLIGGFILGTAVSHASDRDYNRAPARNYRYYDPSCDESWSSLDECRMHFREHRRSPRVIRVIEVSSGECVRTVHYNGNDWQDYDDRDWDRNDGYRR